MPHSPSKEHTPDDLLWCWRLLATDGETAHAIFLAESGALLDATPSFGEAAGISAAAPGNVDFGSLLKTPRIVRRDVTSPQGTRLLLLSLPSRPESLHQAHLMIRAFEQSAEAILITDNSNIIVDVNPAFCHLTGYSREEAIGQNPRILASGRTTPEQYQEMWQALEQSGNWQGEIWDQRKDGSVYPKWMVITTVRDMEDERITHYIASFSDLTERKAAAEKLAHLAHHDPLTDLFNRNALEHQLVTTLASARRDNSLVGLLLIDMDRFKEINDTLGHHVGDGLLIQVAERLKEAVRSSDIVARLGGDEFVIVLPDIANPMSVSAIASKLRRSIAEPYLVEDHSLYSSPSIGIAIYPHDGSNAEALLRNADLAMYHAKSQGRNNFQFFDESMNRASSERMQIETLLRAALENISLDSAPQFRLHFQPQIHMESRRIVGFEALARWIQPELGFIPPMQFIPIAEETGLIQPLGDWVFWEACRNLRAFKDAGLSDIRVAVNLSCQQLRHEALPVVVRGALACYDLQPSELELEITESTAMQNPEATIAILEQLSDMGIVLAIDDFGTGYSSLAYLKHLPIHRLKLDRSFIHEVNIDRSDAAICSATIVLGHNLGLDLVAEGVETDAQREFLQGLGCDVLQGFLYCKPLPAERVVDFVREWNAKL